MAVAVNTCLVCTNKDNTDVKSCKYEVSNSPPVFEATFSSYTSSDCASGKKEIDKISYEEGTCLSVHDQDCIFTYLQDITSPSQFGSGFIIVNYQNNVCTAPADVTIIGYYINICISDDNTDDNTDDDTDDDNYSSEMISYHDDVLEYIRFNELN